MACASCGQKSINNIQPTKLLRKRLNPTFIPARNAERKSEWWWQDELNYVFDEGYSTKEALLMHITKYRHENALPQIPFLSDVVENFICSQECMSQYSIEYLPDYQVAVSASQYLHGAKAWLKGNLLGDAALVSQEIAEKRGTVCMNCPFNQTVVNGKQKHDRDFANSEFARLKGDRKTSIDGALQVCAMCTCSNENKVWFSDEVIYAGLNEELKQKFVQTWLGVNNKPMNCWMKETIENNAPKLPNT